MQLTYFLTAAFAASASAATFRGFVDLECQTSTGEYVRVTGKELEALTAKDFPGEQTWPEMSRNFSGPDDKKNCPSNSDDTYKWIHIPQWTGRPNGDGVGGIAVVYYEETDLYSMCRYHAAVQSNNYAGFCNVV